jgi:hypothetical protein
MTTQHKRNLTVIVICLLFLCVSFNSSFGLKLNDNLSCRLGYSNILLVGGSDPDSYIKIQDAIDDASDGDIIFVFRGKYYENLVIDKNVFLFGEDKDITIIDGGKSSSGIFPLTDDSADNVLFINSTDAVEISDFSIRNGEIGIVCDNSSNMKISFCNIYSNNIGLRLNNSNENLIFQCSIFKNSIDGVQLSFSSYNLLNKSNIFLNDRGSFFENSIYNTVKSCNISNNNLINVCFSDYSHNNTVFRCNINKGSSGLVFESFSNDNIVYHNNFVSNNDQDIDNAYDECENAWDRGNITGGNYWDDYNGSDENGDGIGDTPYIIEGGESMDNYPLMSPEIYFDITGPSVQISKPVRGLYILGLLARRYLIRRPLIIGGITIGVDVNDNSIENSSLVEFYINGKLRKIDSTPPFDYKFRRDRFKIFGHRYEIGAIAIDQSGNSGEAYIKAWKFL